MRKPLGMLAAVVLLVGLARIATAAPSKYRIDRAHSSVGFAVRHMMVSKVRGEFTRFNGTITYDPEDTTAWSVDATIEAASINTGNNKRDEHLRSADFFNVERFPEIVFHATGVRRDSKRLLLDGELTMHGVTRPLTLELETNGTVTDPWGNERIGFSARGKLDRRDFGIVWNKTLDKGGLTVGNEVTVLLEAEGIRNR